MTYVIGEPCVDVLDRACVQECPVDCIHESHCPPPGGTATARRRRRRGAPRQDGHPPLPARASGAPRRPCHTYFVFY